MDSSKLIQICAICGNPIEGHGNNAQPVVDGVCCDKCNKLVVIPARLISYRENFIS